MMPSPSIARPQRRPSFLLALGRQCPRFASVRQIGPQLTPPIFSRNVRSARPLRHASPRLAGKPIGQPLDLNAPQRLTPRPNPHSARGTVAAPPPAISCLGAFRTRPPERVDRFVMPASENLVWGLSVSRKNSPCTESFCHVIRLHCGTAALLLGCAERSEPRSRVRRAEGAGLDRECANQATISLPRRTNVQRALFDLLLFCRFSFHRHASFRSLKIRFDMIRGELAIGRGNRATTLYSVDPRGSVP